MGQCEHEWVMRKDLQWGKRLFICRKCDLPLVGHSWWRRVSIPLTHVLILAVPERYRAEAGQYERKLYRADQLPPGFIVTGSPGWDWWLKYKDDGTVGTACAREFFQRLPGGRWMRYPFFDHKSPEEALEEAGVEAIGEESSAPTEPGH